MKFIKKLMGKDERRAPQWDIKPAAERPEPRKPSAADDSGELRVAAARSAGQAVPRPQPQAPRKEKNPFLDDEMLDTMSLVADDLVEENPYATQSLEQLFESETKRLRTLQIDEKELAKSGGNFNPYDTGSMRRGWKR